VALLGENWALGGECRTHLGEYGALLDESSGVCGETKRRTTSLMDGLWFIQT